MSFPIPKIEYLNSTSQGTTVLNSGVITGIPDTSVLQVGMFVKGVGIPTGALIGTIDSIAQVTLASSVVATANGTAITLDFGFAIAFDYPPKEETGEILDSKNTSSESLSGVRQTSLNYIEAIRKPIFSFLTQTIYDSVDTFLKNHALLGNSFRYFEDKTLTVYTEYELATFKTTPKKITGKTATTYVWEIPLDFRRAL